MTRKNLTLICNSIAFAEIARSGAARVLCVGGELRGLTSALVGAMALSWLENLRADWAFVGATGLSEEGASTTELSESAIKQALLARATHGVLVADASKWGKPAAVRFAPWSAFTAWVPGDKVPAAVSRALAKVRGPRIVRGGHQQPEQRKKA
jgi:DeoR family fructose operon transcriptional repressor